MSCRMLLRNCQNSAFVGLYIQNETEAYCLYFTNVSQISSSSSTLIIFYILSAYGVNCERRILYDLCTQCGPKVLGLIFLKIEDM
jgi:hypothetical protein